MSKTRDQVAVEEKARVLMSRIRDHLARVEDVIAHAECIRGRAYLESLIDAESYAGSAVVHVMQTSVPKVGP